MQNSLKDGLYSPCDTKPLDPYILCRVRSKNITASAESTHHTLNQG